MSAESDDFRAPLPVDPDQWPEARGFRRVFTRDPDRQARVAKVLLGFRQNLIEWHGDDQTIAAIDVVLRTFHSQFPEFMEDGFQRESDSEWGSGAYRADDRLLRRMHEILDQPDIAT